MKVFLVVCSRNCILFLSVVLINNNFYTTSGTTAATAVIAGMISLVNSIRLQQNNPPLGWINPSIYE